MKWLLHYCDFQPGLRIKLPKFSHVLLGAEPVQKAFRRNSWLITSCLKRRSRHVLESDAGRYGLLIPEEGDRSTKSEERTCYELQYCVEFFINMKSLGVGVIQQRYNSFLKGDQEPSLNDSTGLKCECTHTERDGAL